MSPDRKCFCFVILYFCSFVTGNPTKNAEAYPLVELTQEWRQGMGWVVDCTWDMGPEDQMEFIIMDTDLEHASLMFRRGQKRVEKVIPYADNTMNFDCTESIGKCTLILKNLPPMKDFGVTCEVTGGKPYFRSQSNRLTIHTVAETARAKRHIVGYPEIELTQEWTPGKGWTVNCNWDLGPDHLYTVKFKKDNESVASFNPTEGKPDHRIYPIPDYTMRLTCTESPGKCNFVIKPMQPPKKDFDVTCEVLGDSPSFRFKEASLTINSTESLINTVEQESKESENSTSTTTSKTVVYPQIELTQVGRSQGGWDVNCSWDLGSEDHLYTAKFIKDAQIIANFRPSDNPNDEYYVYPTPGYTVHLTCTENPGRCTLIIEPKEPSKKDFYISCEVTGREPSFQYSVRSLKINTAASAIQEKRIASYPQLDFTQEWRQGVGWVINCNWDLGPENRLLSLKMRKDGELVSGFNPTYGYPDHHIFPIPDYTTRFNCTENPGKCTFIIKPKQPPKEDFDVTCEMTEREPTFEFMEKKISINAAAAKPRIDPVEYPYIEVTQEWRSEVGWVVNCNWDLGPDDKLFSTTLKKDTKRVANFHPADDYGPANPRVFPTPDDVMNLTCTENPGKCTLIINPKYPPKKDFEMLCEVLGSQPTYKIAEKSLIIHTDVSPSDAVNPITVSPRRSNVVYPQMELTQEWRPGMGWFVDCSWDLGPEDQLYLARFTKDTEILANYRPMVYADHQVLPTEENAINLTCTYNPGKCNLVIIPKQTLKEDFNVSCEVSGGEPMFQYKKKSLKINAHNIVPPSSANNEVSGNTEDVKENGAEFISENAERSNSPSRIKSESLVAIAQPIRNNTVVELTQEWRPEVGWVVTCSWDLAPHDRLQSVNLHRDSQHFADFRPAPKFNGPYIRHSYSTPDDDMQLVCEESAAKCTLTIEPLQPPKKDINILCEASGEGPMFRVGRKNLTIDTAVPPRDVHLAVSRVTEDSNPVLNCSATGVPAPKIEWTTGEEDTKIGKLHSSRVWNATSKLWYAWSTYIPASHQVPVRCTVKVLKGSISYGSQTVEYNAASQIEFERILGTILTSLYLIFLK